MKQQTTEFYIETRERIVFRRTSAQEVETVCAACGGAAAVFIVPERAAFLFDLTTREIYRRIERGAIHFLETDAGATLVCAASLSPGADELQRLNLRQDEVNEQPDLNNGKFTKR